MTKISQLLKKYKIFPNKKLGQNFLNSDSIINQIISTSNISKEDYVIEIGPGLGHLTELLIKHAKKVMAIEIDQKMVEILKNELKDNFNLTIVYADILQTNLQELIASNWPEIKTNHTIKVIANLPYYITSPILIKLFENYQFWNNLTLMMQKEVAQRLTASPNQKIYNNLSIMTKYYSNAKIAFDVPKEAFIPAPDVTSSVVIFSINQTLPFAYDPQFWKFTRACFSYKRKTLMNNLIALGNNRVVMNDLLKQLNWKLDVRAEQLALNDFHQLYLLQKNK